MCNIIMIIQITLDLLCDLHEVHRVCYIKINRVVMQWYIIKLILFFSGVALIAIGIVLYILRRVYRFKK